MSSHIRINRSCQHCGKEFIAKTTVTKYCGDKCAKQAYKARKRAEKISGSIQATKALMDKPVLDLQMKDFLSIQEVCQLFKVGRTTIWRLIKNGKVDAAKIGRKKFISRNSINALFHPAVKDSSTALQDQELLLDDCWNLGEIQKLFGIHDKTLYDIIQRFEIPKMQKGKMVFVPKDKIINIFGEPKQL